MTSLVSLPVGVVTKLCQQLNMEGAGVRNWKDLITKVKDPPYDLYAVQEFWRSGQRPYSSPAQEVLTDFNARGMKVDDLYGLLAEMEAWGCMTILQEFVSAAVVDEMRRRQEALRSEYKPQLCDSNSDSRSPSPPQSFHPKIGALPSRPPPMVPPPGDMPTSEAPPTSHMPFNGHRSESSSVSQYPPQLSQHPPQHASHQGSPPFVQRPEGRPSLQRTDSWTTAGESYDTTAGHTHVPHPPPSSGQISSSSFSSSVFAYDSSPSGDSFSQATPSSSGTTPSSSVGQSIGCEPGVEGSVALNILHFSYAELSEATGGFTEGMIGIGAFGTVFRATVRGNGPYAIKKLHTEAEMGLHCGQFYEAFHRDSFSQELQLLTRYHHKNILSLVAHSNDGYRPCLVYEYMENGSLTECLLGKRGLCLRWDIRLSIATQVAEALHFLHTVNKPTCLVHGDVKSANILLDAHFVPKLSDFGLARELVSKANSRSTLSTRSQVVMGTMAYMAPEFIRNKKLTARTDVYAFGVVMLELYTGQPPLSNDPACKDRMLTDRLSELLENSEEHRGEVLMSADEHAGWPQDTGLGLFDIISVCLQAKQRLRPPIRQVLDQLVILPQ